MDTLLIVGSRLAYELIPVVRRSRPGIGVVDQLFNSIGHKQSHQAHVSQIDLTIVPLTDLQAILLQEWGTISEVVVIPHAIPDVELAPSVATPRDGDDHALTIGFFGRWSDEKAPDLFVEIARSVDRSCDARYLMTGDGPMHETVRDLIRKYRLQDRLETPGFVKDVASLMASVDVVVVPSRLDGMPLVVLEAMKAGKPIVSSAVGSIPEVIDDGHTGYLCQPGDIEGFAARILELARDQTLRQAIGTAASRRYAETYSWDRVYSQYREAFAAASSRAARRSDTSAQA